LLGCWVPVAIVLPFGAYRVDGGGGGTAVRPPAAVTVSD
jgi:hypothetical protein